MTKQGWIKRFDKEIYPELKGYGTKAVAFLIKQFISQELSTFAKEVEREVIGKDEDVTNYIYDGQGNKIGERTHKPNRKAMAKNALRAKQHQALTKLKKEKGIK